MSDYFDEVDLDDEPDLLTMVESLFVDIGRIAEQVYDKAAALRALRAACLEVAVRGDGQPATISALRADFLEREGEEGAARLESLVSRATREVALDDERSAVWR